MSHITPDSAATIPRIVWVRPEHVDGPLTEGRIVRAVTPLSEFCLRSDDGREPIPAGCALRITETRPYGEAMAEELPPTGQLLNAALDLQADGLYEVTA